MRRHALLIGSETAGLTGVLRDVERLGETLRRRDDAFDVTVCVGDEATREGILRAYRSFIGRVDRGDAALVYYSGHGGLAQNPAYPAARAEGRSVPRDYQFIVPADFHDGGADDFRGILRQELAALLAQLTAKTKNVAVVFDCCHSAQMTRDAFAVARALPHPVVVGVDAYLDRLRSDGVAIDDVDPLGNPDAVRLVACAREESAYELPIANVGCAGILTDSLIVALRELGGIPTTWSIVGRFVRERVLSFVSAQRPSVEGPASRILFSTELGAATGVLAAKTRDGVVVLEGGAVHGVRRGDEYALMPMNAARLDRLHALGDVRVSSVAATTSLCEFIDAPPNVPSQVLAFLTRKTGQKRGIRIDVPPSESPCFEDALARSSLVEEQRGDRVSAESLATVRVDGGMLSLRDRAGDLLPPVEYSKSKVAPLVLDLDRLAVAQSVRELAGAEPEDDFGAGPRLPRNSFEIEWGVVVDGKRVPHAESGDVLSPGQAIYVALRNTSDRTLYFHIFNIGVGSRVARVSSAEPFGIRVAAGEETVLGQSREGAPLLGMKLFWPDHVPKNEARTDEIIVIATGEECDLGALETTELATRAIADRSQASRLGALASQLRRGGTRNIAPPETAANSFTAERISFLLEPTPMPATTPLRFFLDETPSHSMRGSVSRGVRSSRTLAVRLAEVVVHENKALFGADLRIDAMVVTRAAKGATPYAVETLRFYGVRNGDRLSLDDALLFHGEVADFVDLALWVSRARSEDATFIHLLNQHLGSPAIQSAIAALAAGAAVSPLGASGIAAASAATLLVATGYDILARTLGATVGTYRTSLLAREHFGLGRHPVNGLHRAQGFSFAYSVDAAY